MKHRALMIALALALGAPAVASATGRETPAQVTAGDRTPARSAQHPRSAAYAQREQQSKELEKFEGGQTVVIAVSLTTILIVALILVILL